MKNITHTIFYLALTTVLLGATSSGVLPEELWTDSTYHYSIEPESVLSLDGTSNILDFTCRCGGTSGSGQLTLLAQGEGYRFQNSHLQLPARALDCGKRAMNRDMYDALKSEQYPVIVIQLTSARAISPVVFAECDEWSTFETEVLLTIAGTTRSVSMRVRGAHLGYQRYQFIGEQAIYLTDFGIDPPRALLGTVRVDNCITINIDLLLRLTTI